MRFKPFAGRLTAALLCVIVAILSGCGRRDPGPPSIDRSATIDINDRSTLLDLAYRSRLAGEYEESFTVDDFAKRKAILGYLGEPAPAVHTFDELLAYERHAPEPLSVLEARIADGVTTLDFHWRALRDTAAVVEDPGRVHSTVSSTLGNYGTENTREISPGIWFLPWSQRHQRPDAYVIRAVATTHVGGEWTAYRTYVFHDGRGPDLRMGCSTPAAAREQAMWAYCELLDIDARPATDGPLFERLLQLQLGGAQPTLVGGTVVFSHHNAVEAEFVSGDRAVKAAAELKQERTGRMEADRTGERMRWFAFAQFWAVRLAIFGLPMAGAWWLFRQRGGDPRRGVSRALWMGLAVVLVVVAYNAGILAHPGRSYPDAWGPAGIIDYILIAIAIVAGLGGLFALRRALREPS
ncbi:MAG: hypothetical protein ABWX83_04300 [Luteibacter sp.]